ncbi:MAG: glutamyl-tRNA reductase [Selenomonadaceae bacterium]|nr:glutamyl-tRNA reductase [Selenomonadaceae bacterium]
MELIAVGLNHKTAPVAVRERFSLGKEAIRQGLTNLSAYPGINEAVILSTCNRSELYAEVNDADTDKEAVRQFLFDLTGNDETVEDYLYTLTGEDTIRHLFAVTASLDSLVLGEGQILSQVKAAYTLSRELGTTGTVLNTLFHRAIAVGKRVRTETRIAYSAVSVSYAAVELARKKLGGLEGATALIYGAGKMAELTVQHLRSHGIKQIYVANRHVEKARELAAAYGGQAVPWEEAMDKAVFADIIVTSTGAPHYVVKTWETKKLMVKRRERPLFFIDIAVPRDVEPEVAQIRGVTLYNIDALEAVVEGNVADRKREAAKAATIVTEEVAALTKKFRYLTFRPLMAQLSDKAERIRQREIRRAAAKLPTLKDSEAKALDQLTKMIVRKLLRVPMMKLNAAAGTSQEDFYKAAMEALFVEGAGETREAKGGKEHRHYRYAGQ